MKKAVFLDRDGVINVKRNDYVKNVSEFVMLKDSPKAIRLLNDKEFTVIIITNQSAVNRGLLTLDELEKIHSFMKKQLEKDHAFVDAIYFCPHRPDENCECRKPKSGLILRAISDHSISPSLSWFIGDSETDMQAAKQVGLNAVMMQENGNLLETISILLD